MPKTAAELEQVQLTRQSHHRLVAPHFAEAVEVAQVDLTTQPLQLLLEAPVASLEHIRRAVVELSELMGQAQPQARPEQPQQPQRVVLEEAAVARLLQPQPLVELVELVELAAAAAVVAASV